MPADLVPFSDASNLRLLIIVIASFSGSALVSFPCFGAFCAYLLAFNMEFL
jgi:hypothetical protein